MGMAHKESAFHQYVMIYVILKYIDPRWTNTDGFTQQTHVVNTRIDPLRRPFWYLRTDVRR